MSKLPEKWRSAEMAQAGGQLRSPYSNKNNLAPPVSAAESVKGQGDNDSVVATSDAYASATKEPCVSAEPEAKSPTEPPQGKPSGKGKNIVIIVIAIIALIALAIAAWAVLKLADGGKDNNTAEATTTIVSGEQTTIKNEENSTATTTANSEETTNPQKEDNTTLFPDIRNAVSHETVTLYDEVNKVKFVYHIPKINGDTNDIWSTNYNIMSKVGGEIDVTIYALENGWSLWTTGAYYDVYCYEDVMTVVTCLEGKNGYHNYDSYSINTITGKKVLYEDVLERAGVTEQALVELIRQCALEDHAEYLESCYWATESEKQYCMEEMEGYIDDCVITPFTLAVFLNSDGELCVSVPYALIYSEFTYKIIAVK